jgi:integrase/recombinase XerD
MVSDAEILAAQKKKLLEIEMPDSNIQVIHAFFRKIKGTNSLHSQINYINILIHFCREIKTDFRDISHSDIYLFLDFLDDCTYTSKSGKLKPFSDATKNSYKVLLRSFLKTIPNLNKKDKPFYRNISKDDLEELIEIKNIKNTKLPEELLTGEEVERMIDVTTELRDKAIIATLYESGARKGEMLACKINSLQFDENGCVITFPGGKTGARRIRVIRSSIYLSEWVEKYHPLKDQKDAPLWVTLKEPYNLVAQNTFSLVLKRAAKKAGITKPINPHAWRHASATKLASHLTEQQMKKYLGWTPGSNMPAVYVHLSGKDIDDAILKMNGVKVEETEDDALKQIRCPRCKTFNERKFVHCYKCGMPLSQTEAQRLENDKSEIDIDFIKAIMTSPDIMDEMKKRLQG